MSASSEALLVEAKSELIQVLVPYEFPIARVVRATRVTLDCIHLRNVVWGMPCGSCGRPSFDQPTFVYVENDEMGTPMIYAGAVCHNFIFEEWWWQPNTNNAIQSARAEYALASEALVTARQKADESNARLCESNARLATARAEVALLEQRAEAELLEQRTGNAGARRKPRRRRR